MGVIGKQFGSPTGLLGRVAARVMAHNNADFNQQLVRYLAESGSSPAVVAEVGFGPGMGLEALLEAFPAACVLGADPSVAVLREAERRNRAALQSGRLRLSTGDAGSLSGNAPIDLVLAVHVLYFWSDPVAALRQIRGLLPDGGRVALGYQLKQHMPLLAQRDFPAEGHVLYESDDAVKEILTRSGLVPQDVVVLGAADSPLGRILVGDRNPPPIS
jgi:SAM-dependent methyltransferase